MRPFLPTGVCDLNGKVYCIGGWNGQCGMKQCNAFDPSEGKWKEIAPLNYGMRIQKRIVKQNFSFDFYLNYFAFQVDIKLP